MPGCGSDSICNGNAFTQDSLVVDKRCPLYRNLLHQEPVEAPDSCPDVPAPKNCLADKDCPHGSYCCLSICEGITRCYDPIRDKFMTSAHNKTRPHLLEKKKERICSGSSSESSKSGSFFTTFVFYDKVLDVFVAEECEWVSSEETVEVSVSDENQSGDQTARHRDHHHHDGERQGHKHHTHSRGKISKHDHKGSHGSDHGKADNHRHTHTLHEDSHKYGSSPHQKGSTSNEQNSRKGMSKLATHVINAVILTTCC